LLGVASNFWQLFFLSAVGWFSAGVNIALVNILAGLFAEEEHRGKIFGIIRLAMGFGYVIGGLTSGPMVDLWGYTMMFRIFSLFYVILPLTGVLLEDRIVTRISADKEIPKKGRTKLPGVLFLLVAAVIVSQVSRSAGFMGRSLIMNERGFSAAAISSTNVVTGLISVPLFLLLGWLSDRVGRKRLIGLCYLVYTIGMLVLAVSVSLWQFYIFSFLLAFMLVSYSVGSALVTDLVPKESLGRSMSLFLAAYRIGGVVGFFSAGYAFQSLGMTSSIFFLAFLPLLAILLLIPIREKKELRIQKR
jgi:MFS family permease